MPRKIYTDEMNEFMKVNVVGIPVHTLVELVNQEFETNFTYTQIRNYMNNNGLKNGRVRAESNKRRVFTQEIEEFITQNVKGLTLKELTGKVNQTFNTSYSEQQIKNYKARNKLKSGVDGTFKKGFVPHNKGKKGECAPGSEKGWFKKGHVSKTCRTIGAERIDNKDGYIWVKIEGSKRWKCKHRIIWERHNGPIPKAHVIIFLDGDRTNTDINNLALITRNELKIMNQFNLKSDNKEATETGILIARLKSKSYERQKEVGKVHKEVPNG